MLGMPTSACARLGAVAAKHVIQRIGAQFELDQFSEVQDSS